jgi:uncharacterized membrane protein
MLIILPSLLFSTVVALVIGSTVKIGHARYYLRIADRKLTWIGALFTYYRQWVTAFLTELLKLVYTALWSLLLIIPGIITALNYSMTPFILAENPLISPTEAMRRSKEIMRGNRWRLVCLHFSFIGWTVLSILSFGIGFVFLNPYINAATADFYRDITGSRGFFDFIVDDPSSYNRSNDNDWYHVK